ncbi:hypothetical protein BJF93_18525 [Xaviernesmea oryzae]|uniref:FecR protein domain-containing protein n=1 Tax=Xaviernesmea oryzae TaxID=464029 RepID=A0A1Q9B2G2_9HYPH|nr:FecR domain-containing protein [Xaviernesmea oryzae]OLP62220.1 hypothetical protein BJF93_18525 [Xaviernesmea oryzae]SEL92254.1 FecR family protein [Xaviernesmea oryzae]
MKTKVAAGLALLLASGTCMAEPVARGAEKAGAVIARKTGEEIRFVEKDGWQIVDLAQDVVNGDVLRTNANGQLAILFSDRTQMRLGRNSTLVVRDVKGGGADAELMLQSGSLWARAERGGAGLKVETPAATAAIRGTDWTLSVDAGGRTSLNVLDGLVELSNGAGSVQVARGEGAVAAIGQAPRKIIITNSDDREQMLYYLGLRDSMEILPASPLPGPELRARHHVLTLKPEAARTAADWLDLAETRLAIEGRRSAEAALTKAENKGLPQAMRARADYVAGLIAISDGRYGEAAEKLRRARGRLDAQRRSLADYVAYFARALAEPERVEQPPTGGTGPQAVAAEALSIGFRQSIRDAIAVLKRGEARYPDDALLPAMRGKIALVLNDQAQAEEAIAKALARDPDQPIALEARADLKASRHGDLKGAEADLRRAIAAYPGDSNLLNSLALLQSAQGLDRAAADTLRQAIALDPKSANYHANLAIFYLDRRRVKDARKEIDAALAADPGLDLMLVARGRYHLQTGENDKALEDLLAGSVANPAYAQAQLLLAIAHYSRGERIAYEQAMDNAERIDPNDPAIASVRTAVAIQDYDSDQAIRQAQTYLKLERQRGGDFAALGAQQESGSVLKDAFALQGLGAWGQYYGDAVFDPFAGTAYLDQSVRGSADPFVNALLPGGNAIDPVSETLGYSGLLQGLLLDPQMLSASALKRTLVPTPFLEAELGIGVNDTDSETKWVKTGQIQGYSNLPFPISFSGDLSWEDQGEQRIDADRLNRLDLASRITQANGFITASPTDDDRLIALFQTSKSSTDNGSRSLYNIPAGLVAAIPNLATLASDDSTQKLTTATLGWSHSFSDRNILNAALFYDESNGSSDRNDLIVTNQIGVLTRGINQNTSRSYMASLGHIDGMGDLTLRTGVEGGFFDLDASTRTIVEFIVPDAQGQPVFVPGTDETVGVSSRVTAGLVYVDGLFEITPHLKLEAGLFGRLYQGGPVDVQRLEPRVGVAWEPVDGQWLRAGYLREGFLSTSSTLSPLGIVALQSNMVPLAIEGYKDTLAFRWDSEWSDRLFTAVDVQHQEARQLSINDPFLLPGASLLSGDIAKGSIDRAAVTANYLIGHGFGLSATYARLHSRDEDAASATFGMGLPYVAEEAGQVALTFVNPIGISTTLAANYTGTRRSRDGGELDGYWTLDAGLTYETPDKHLNLTVTAYNLLDEDFDVATRVPGWGRSVKALLKVRF